MATKTYGAKGTNDISQLIDSSRYCVSKFIPDDWGGNNDPQSNRAIYVVTKIKIWVKYTDTDASVSSRTVNVVCGSDYDDPTDKANSLGINSVGTGVLSGSFNEAYADTSFAVGSDNDYFVGFKPNSSSGATTERGASAHPTYSVVASTGSISYTWNSSSQWVEFTYYGLPAQVANIDATSTGQNSATVTFSQVATSGVAGATTGYKVQFKKSSDAAWTDYTTTTGYPLTGVSVTGLDAGTSYNFRVAAVNGVSSFVSTATGPWSSTASTTTDSATPKPTFSGTFNTGQVNVSYSDYISVTNANSVEIKSGSGSLPPGLTGSFNSSTGRYTVANTPTTAGTYTFTLTATGPGGSQDSSQYSIVIAEQPAPSWSDQSLSNYAVIGDFYDDSVSATNTSSYGLTGTAPSGTQFDTTNGRLYGTLTAAGTYTFTIYAYGPTGLSTNKTFTVTVDTVILLGGKRFSGSTPTTLSTYKRKSGASWIELTIAKRRENGNWVDI